MFISYIVLLYLSFFHSFIAFIFCLFLVLFVVADLFFVFVFPLCSLTLCRGFGNFARTMSCPTEKRTLQTAYWKWCMSTVTQLDTTDAPPIIALANPIPGIFSSMFCVSTTMSFSEYLQLWGQYHDFYVLPSSSSSSFFVLFCWKPKN